MTLTVPVWRLTRTAPARRLYDALTAAGLRVSVLDLYRRELSDAPAGAAGSLGEPTDGPTEVEVETYASVARPPDWTVDDPGLEPDHRVIGAVAEGDLVGVTLLSLDGPVYVEPLDRMVAFDGGYLWDVEVHPDWRRRGIASALVSTALGDLRREGTSAAYALIAPDNLPSRTLFRSAGFAPERRHVYVDAFGFEHRSTRSHAGETSSERQ